MNMNHKSLEPVRTLAYYLGLADEPTNAAALRVNLAAACRAAVADGASRSDIREALEEGGQGDLAKDEIESAADAAFKPVSSAELDPRPGERFMNHARELLEYQPGKGWVLISYQPGFVSAGCVSGRR